GTRSSDGYGTCSTSSAYPRPGTDGGGGSGPAGAGRGRGYRTACGGGGGFGHHGGPPVPGQRRAGTAGELDRDRVRVGSIDPRVRAGVRRALQPGRVAGRLVVGPPAPDRT